VRPAARGILAVALAAASAGAAAAPRRPNLILIVTDDMDMASLPYMPRVKALLTDHGTNFSNSFVSQPVCGPSRGSILTGRYAHNHGMLYNKPPNGGYKRFFEKGNESATLAVWLSAAGYRTAILGKYINRFPAKEDNAHVPAGWSDFFLTFFPEDYFEYKVNDAGRFVVYDDSPEDYQTDVLARKALAFIASAASNREQPFFLYLAPFAPHRPATPHPRHAHALADVKAPRLPSFDEADVSDKPSWVRAQPRLTPTAIAELDERFRDRLRTLLAVDEMVERLVQDLAARGLLDDTFIFFTSDNGFHFGAHRLDHGKADPYEESIRVPLVVRGPGVPAARSAEPLVANIDLAPTLVELGGGSAPPAQVDGRSLAPWLLGATPPAWRHDLLLENWDSGRAKPDDRDEPDGGVPQYAGLRSDDSVYVEYPKGERELYDLRRDPFELENAAAHADRQQLARLAQRLAALKSCSGEACRR